MTQAIAGTLGQPIRIRTRLVSGVAWTIMLAIATQGSALLCSVISARLLGCDAYGRLAMLLSLIAAFTNFAGMGLGVTATKAVSEFRNRAPDRAGRILGLCALVTATAGLIYATVLVVCAPWIAGEFLKSPGMVNEIRLCSVAVLFMTMNNYQVSALQGMETFSMLTRVACILGPITVALTLGLTWSFRLTGAAMVTGLVALISWALHQVMLRKETRRWGIRIRYDHLCQELPVLHSFTLPAAISAVVGGIALSGASAVLARQHGGFEQLAIFSAANTLRSIALFLPNRISRVSLPILCNLRANNDAGRYQKTFWTCLVFNMGLTAGLAVVLYAIAPLVLAMFGRSFAVGRAMPAMLLASAVAETTAIGLYQVVYSHGKMWTHLAICSLWAAILLGMTMWVANSNGAAGMAGAYLTAWTTAAILFAVAARRLSPKDGLRQESFLH